MSRLLCAALLTVLAAAAAPAMVFAHGGGPGLDYDPCARWVGVDSYVHFSAYQPQFNRFAEYCGSVPRAGETLLVFDLVGSELTGESVAISLAREDGGRSFALPGRRYPSGVINLSLPLAAGDYHAVLTIGGPPEVRRIDFDVTVGAWWAPLVTPFLIIGILLAAALAYCLYQGRRMAGEAADHPQAAAAMRSRAD